ncbi:MAG: 1-acyl-sn-glycerol-3-phosphate acyltransferase [Proteobacteria bacterium]|nr:1-acyl-sn-glycerol-3-phosphate acyltransferase [Pseudomonadota bacterium]MBU1739136.1 1-acyl-sn-glycerol-3-phosphate acyltransferase [Pseudomonadota bacterium]
MLKKVLLNLYFWPLFSLVTLAAVLLSPVLLAGNLIFTRQPTARMVRKCIRLYGWILVRVIPFMAPVTVEDRSGGIEEPVIFVPNHCSSVDPYLFGMLPLDNAFVTSWPFRIPLYNFFMHLSGYINSNKGWKHVLERGSELLGSGCSLIIWPEGHRSRDGKLRRFKNGAFQLALSTGRPVVPVCVIGSRQMLPPGSRFLTPARIRMILLPAITPSGRSNSPEDIRSLKMRVKNALAEELAGNTRATRRQNCPSSSSCSCLHETGRTPGNEAAC